MKKNLRRILTQWGDLEVPVTALDDTADLYAAGLSSMATVQLLMAIESEFEIEIPDRLLTRALFQNIDSLAKVIAELCAGKSLGRSSSESRLTIFN